MISQKLKTIFAISIPVFIAHGMEEYFTGLYQVDSHVSFVFGYFYTLPAPQAMFLLFQISFWVVLLISFLLIADKKWHLPLATVLGLIYVYELHHLYKAVVVGGYYPGLVTGLAFPVIGFFFWKELFKEFRERHANPSS